MNDIWIELAIRTPVAAVAIYSIWRMSIVMVMLAKTLESIAISQNDTVGGVVRNEMQENAKMREIKPILPLTVP